MQGQTTANVLGEKRCTDPHTLLLLTDDTVDRSMYRQGIQLMSAPASSNFVKRDDRNSIYFDSGSGIRILNKSFTTCNNDWTIECWCYPLDNRSAGIYWQQLNSNYTGLLWGYSSSGTASASQMYLSSVNDGNWNLLSNVTTASSEAAVNTWSHRALVHDGTYIRAYTNGKLVNSWNVTSSWTFNGWSYIGYYYSGSPYWYGYLQDYRISDIARYNENFTPLVRLL